MKLNDLLLVPAFLFGSLVFAQPSNDDCSSADRLCPNVVLSGTTTAATTDAATDYSFCYSPSSTIWYLFTTNAAGGNVTIDFTNLSFNPDPTMGQQIEALIISAVTPCVPSSPYTPYSACGSGATDFSISSAVALNPNTTYYVQVNGANTGPGVTQPAECDFNITISGPAIDKTPPTASISAANTTLCYGDTEIVNATVAGCADTSSFDWYFDGVLLSSGSSSTYDAGTLPGAGYLKLVVLCDVICTQADTTDSIYFDVTPISADAGPDKFIAEGGQVALEGSGDGTPSWTPGTTLTDASSYTPTATPSTATTYFLTVTNGTCVATDSVNVFVGEVITIYSSFTPNGDDINDKWVIRNSGSYDNIEIFVYDRSGQVVFHTTNYSTQDKWWDGTFQNKGDALPASTYFYVIDLKEGSDPIYKGSVTIIR
jgi:gliding motility-associated-like protein